jgi:2-oxoglutarate dehydrogenase E2 component (dihydrolipoamide succinyltransferase)
MIIEIRVPSAGESITQVELAKWLVEDGAYVEKDQEIAEIDSDKATLTINADASGKIEITVEEGTTIEPGKIIGKINTEAEAPQSSEKKSNEAPPEDQPKKETARETASPAPAKPEASGETATHDFTFSPQARKLMDEVDVTPEELLQNPDNRRITKKDILLAIAGKLGASAQPQAASAPRETQAHEHWSGSRDVERHKMSTLRKKVAERLVAVKNQTAMLTTFNEVDMSAVMALRKKHQKAFQEKYGIKLGFMSFFAKAVTESIPFFPAVNGYIEDGHMVLPTYADVGIAVSTPKGLMVPVIRNAESLSIPELEKQIGELAIKARDNKISIEDLSGGTFSITNGGVFGSMLSTPILNPPQSAILGMHNILERPVAINGKVEIRPMMYLALSYDHRIVDGRESVGFLVKVKELIENPEKMMFQGREPESLLLGL